MIIKFKRWHERRGPLNQSWSDFQGTNTSLSVGQFEREITLRTPRVPASSYKRGSHVLEIQLIDERLLARQTETGMWEEALGVRVRTGRRRRWRRRREEEKRRRHICAQPLSFARSLTRLLVPTRRARSSFLRALCTTELGGLGFLRTTREPHNSGTPCRTACHTFRTALKSPVGASARTCPSRPPGRDYAAEPAASWDLSKLCRRERERERERERKRERERERKS